MCCVAGARRELRLFCTVRASDEHAGARSSCPNVEHSSRPARFAGRTNCAVPDPLLAQTLAASTYPLEVLQLQQWLAKNPGLKDKALLDAVAKQPWDPSAQAMAALPDVGHTAGQ